MNLSKRNCGIKMRLVPYGGGYKLGSSQILMMIAQRGHVSGIL